MRCITFLSKPNLKDTCLELSLDVTNCVSSDIACLCTDSNYILAVSTCYSNSCDAADAQEGHKYDEYICSLAGVTVTPASTSTTTGNNPTIISVTATPALRTQTQSPLNTGTYTVTIIGSASQPKGADVGAIVGGVIGGLVALGFIGCILFFFLFRRKGSSQPQAPMANISPFPQPIVPDQYTGVIIKEQVWIPEMVATNP